MQTRMGFWVPALAGLALLAGCGGGSGKNPAAAPGKNAAKGRDNSGDKAPSEGGGITEAEALAFAKQIETTMAADDASFFNQSMDFLSMGKTVSEGLDLSESDRQGFIKGMASQSMNLGNNILKSLNGGSYSLLRVRKVDGMARPLFRLITGGAVNYHELRLSRGPAQTVKIVDLYIYSAGELFTETLRRLTIPMIAQLQPGLLDRLMGTQGDGKAALDAMTRMSRQIMAGQYQAGLDSYRKLPEQMRKDKGILLLRMRAAMNLGTQEYTNAMQDLLDNYPDEPGLKLILVDHYFLKKDFAGALKAIEDVDQALGGDPYLVTLKVGALQKLERGAEAEQLLRDAIAAGPDMAAFHTSLMDVLVSRKEYAALVAEMKHLEEHFQLNFPGLAGIEEYKEFAASSEYREFLKSRQAAPQP